MGLTSETTVYVMAALAAVCVGLLVWSWPRFARRGLWQVFGRLLAIGTTQVVMIAAFACWLNSSYQFFGSWGELFGRVETAPVGVTQAGDEGGTGTGGGVAREGGLGQPAGGGQVSRGRGV